MGDISREYNMSRLNEKLITRYNIKITRSGVKVSAQSQGRGGGFYTVNVAEAKAGTVLDAMLKLHPEAAGPLGLNIIK